MFAVVVQDVNANKAIDIKNQLLQDGLIIDKDFTWIYRQAKYDTSLGWNLIESQAAIFVFNKQSLATFYMLKWK